MNIKPTGGQVAIQFLDEEDEEADEGEATGMQASSPTSDESYNELVYAIVIGVGPEAQKGIKKGDTVLVTKWSRNSPCMDGVHFVDSWAIKASVSV